MYDCVQNSRVHECMSEGMNKQCIFSAEQYKYLSPLEVKKTIVHQRSLVTSIL